MASGNVVVLGAGIGGLSCVNRLRRLLPASERITIIDPRQTFQFAPDLLWVLAGTRRREQFARPMSRMIPAGVEHLAEHVEAIAADDHLVVTSSRSVPYDKLVVALGADTAPASLAGFSEGALDIYSLEGAEAARDALGAIPEGRVVVAVGGMPFKCPAAPYEAAFIADSVLRRRGLRDRTVLDVFTPEPLPMPAAGPGAGHRLAAMLADRGIGLHTERQIISVDGSEKRIRFVDGSTESYDLLLGVPPHRPPEVVAGGALAGPSGYAPVDPRTLAATADVYVIGDAAAVPTGPGKFLPKAGVFAHRQAEVVSDRIAEELSGEAPRREFDGSGSCFVELGGGKAAYARGGFFEAPVSVRMYHPGWWWHLGKVAVEKYWLNPWLWRWVG